MPPGHSSLPSSPNSIVSCRPAPPKMHLFQPMLLLASIGSALAHPLSPNPLEKKSTLVEEAAWPSLKSNRSCPADPLKYIEHLVFDTR